MSTLQPRPPYTDSELAELYPAQLQLQLVQILLRHGERTPVTPRFQNTGLAAFWPYCAAARRFSSAILDPDPALEAAADGSDAKFSTLAWKRRLETLGNNDHPVIASGSKGELDAICDMGMLTDKGRETTTALGRRLRHLYVDRLGFLPPTVSPSTVDSLYLRATPIPRALESMQQAFHGLYPPHTRPDDLPPLTILARPISEETLFPNEGNCRRFAVLARAFAQRAAQRWNDTDDMAFLTKRLGRWMPDGSPSVAVDARPRLSGIMDTINATNAHGPETKLPREFYDPKVRKIIETIGVEEWYAGYRESQEYRSLGIGNLLGDITARMVGSVEHSTADGEYEIQHKQQQQQGSSRASTPIRFGLSGCHDTTLAGTLASLGAFGHDEWPPFTSHIAVELFRHSSTPPTPPRSPSPKSWFPSLFGVGSSGSSASSHPPSPGMPPAGGIGRKKTPSLTDAERSRLDGYYVRLRYNDRPVTIPGCRTPGSHLEGDETFCTLAAFKAIVDKFTPDDWRQQCRSNLDAPAFPAKPEPAGH
ncbi:hypothetical protein ACO1O0_008106 [Amphichorda felina]